ncbi:hypothetical protein [Bacillus rubiinfantis]|uniref:hypothetical protein n=1 Tax=Bacillus rubiinfantis TaxID=1499680 RepID=UPI0011DD5F39|nr:hypothetical protein [Bacillus rubiinfantis]
MSTIPNGEDANLVQEVTKENNQDQRYRYYQWDENGKAVGMVIKIKINLEIGKPKPIIFGQINVVMLQPS